MPFLLTILHETEAANDHFSGGEIARFALPRVRVGSGADCERKIPDETFPELGFTIVARDNRLLLEPAPGVEVRVNDQPAGAGRELLSGDEARVGHWSCRVHKVYGDPGDRRRRTGLAWVARGLVLFLILAELSVVVWLPRQVGNAARRGHELARLRVFAMVDGLREKARRTERHEDEDAIPFKQAARRAIEEDLERRTRFLRKHQNALTPDQCQRMLQELEILADALDRLEQHHFLQPIPGVDLEAAVRAALVRANWSTTLP